MYVAVRVHLRGGDESLWRRVLYALQPNLDPRRKPRPKLTPRANVAIFVGLVIVLAVVLIDFWINA